MIHGELYLCFRTSIYGRVCYNVVKSSVFKIETVLASNMCIMCIMKKTASFPAAGCQDADGNDSDLISLRSALIQTEQRGIVDWELAGHECNRPSGVCQGSEEEDR